MAEVGVVLVHGGQHDAWCWDRVQPLITAPTLAVSLPGRGGAPDRESRGQPSLDAHVSQVIRDIDGRGFEQVVLVGHSMAGVIAPEVAIRLGDRVRHLVLIAADVPPESGTLIDVLPPWQRRPASAWIRSRETVALPRRLAKRVFCNDLDREWMAFVLSRLVPEPLGRLAFQPVSRRGLPSSLPRTYVKCLDDRALPPRCQDRAIEALGADAVPLRAGHDAMLSQPERIAAIINGIDPIRQEGS